MKSKSGMQFSTPAGCIVLCCTFICRVGLVSAFDRSLVVCYMFVYSCGRYDSSLDSWCPATRCNRTIVGLQPSAKRLFIPNIFSRAFLSPKLRRFDELMLWALSVVCGDESEVPCETVSLHAASTRSFSGMLCWSCPWPWSSSPWSWPWCATAVLTLSTGLTYFQTTEEPSIFRPISRDVVLGLGCS